MPPWTWSDLAVFAYKSFLDEGRGAVVLGSSELAYQTDPDSFAPGRVLDPCALIDLRRWCSEYRPANEVVFAVVEGEYLVGAHRQVAHGPYIPAQQYSESMRSHQKPHEWFDMYIERSFRRSQRRRRRLS